MGSRNTLDQRELAAEALELDPDHWSPRHAVAHLAVEHPQVRAWPDDNPDLTHHLDHRDVARREAALAMGVRVAVHDSRQNDRNPVIWQPGQNYRMADALQAARTQPTRARHGPERVGPER